MLRHFSGILLVGFLICFISSCSCHREKKGTKESIGWLGLGKKTETFINLRIDRFEKDLFAINIDSIDSKTTALNKKYKEFFEIYNFKMVNLGDYSSPKYKDELKRFLTDYYMNLNYKKVMLVYPDIKDLTQQLSNAFTIFHNEFPERRIPHIYTCISGWNQSVVTSDTLMGISLDKYLGRDCDFYKQLRYEKYACYTLQREYILPDCMRAWGYSEFAFSDSLCNSVLCNMLYEGKIMYYVKKMLPETPDSILFGFKTKQLQWCKDNTKGMWTYLIENKLLFSSKYMDIRKLLYPAPFTTFYSKDSPGRASVWVGHQIISAYMKENSKETLAQLMKETDYSKILRKSNFKP